MLSFKTKEFLISPTQLGVPNSRLRYYLIAKKVISPRPVVNYSEGQHPTVDIITDLSQTSEISPTVVKQFLQTESCTLEKYLSSCHAKDESLLLSDQVLGKYGEIVDIVKPSSTNSCCFTKSYGRYAEGTGSVIQQDGNLDLVFKRAQKYEKKSENYVKILQELKLRYMDPYEVADILGFPIRNSNENKETKRTSFEFPPEYLQHRLHCYRVLGNSLNVTVVSFLSCILFA